MVYCSYEISNLTVILPRDAMPSWYMLSSCFSVGPSAICPSVTSRHCTKTAKHRIRKTAPYDSPGTLVF